MSVNVIHLLPVIMAIIEAAVGPMISRSGPHMHYALSYSHDWKEVIS